MNFMLSWLMLALSCSWAVASAASAEDPSSVIDLASSGRQVAVVLESRHAGSAERVRAALAKLSGVQITTLEALPGAAEAPPVLLAVSDHTGSGVSVTYWDVTGRIDLLSAPGSHVEEVFESVASALGAALLRRNLPELARDLTDRWLCVGRDWNRMVGEGLAQGWNLVPVHRRTYPITLDDF